MLGLGPAPARGAVAARADPPGAAVAAPRAVPRENLSAHGAYVLAEAEGDAPGDPARHRLGGVDRDGRARRARPRTGFAPRWSRCRAGNCSRRQPEEYRDRGARRRPAGRGRGRGRIRLGPLDRRARRFYRHARISAPRPPARRSTRISASPPKRLPRPPARFYRLAQSLREERTMTVRVAINGFGRIGRLVLRAAYEHKHTEIQVVGVNDLGPVETNAHLLALRQRARPLSRRDHDRRRLDGHRPRQDPGHRRARSGKTAVARTGRRCRARMHRHLHQARGVRPSTSKPAPRKSSSRLRPTAPT